MKYLLLFILFCIVKFVSSQTDTLVINGALFKRIIRTEKSEYNKRDTVLVLYRIEGKTNKYLLKHYLYRWSADCNNEFTDFGKMIVDNDKITFLTLFKQKGNDPIPSQEEQIYMVKPTGKLVLISNKILINGIWKSQSLN